ncbi:hypothetical protein LOAG_04997 [Loa loa]|uniref:Uncharacterized protein n=1 Tax=Loa loa TaxID=7209 RepID=A0A1I7VR06_LOALO|nr:hypothetical protein LOAG_04997 [Loa loa]EFO23483.2 hypothetical protein LOAG_04997 [Loa loa]
MGHLPPLPATPRMLPPVPSLCNPKHSLIRRVTNVAILEQEESLVTTIEAMLLRTQLFWAEHVSGVEDHRFTKMCFVMNSLPVSAEQPQTVDIMTP